jgi:hypothetical protein
VVSGRLIRSFSPIICRRFWQFFLLHVPRAAVSISEDARSIRIYVDWGCSSNQNGPKNRRNWWVQFWFLIAIFSADFR